MKWISLVVLFSFLALTAHTALAPNLGGQPQIRYKITIPPQASFDQIRYVMNILNQNDFDIAGINILARTIEVVTTPEGVNFLKSKKLNGFIYSTEFASSPDKRFLNPTTLLPRLQAIQQINPKLAQIVEIGKSNQGRPIWAMLISTTQDYKSKEYFQKPTLVVDGLHHAREIMTPEIVVDIAETVLKNAQSFQGQNILNNWNIWIVPMLNPDGSNIVWTKNNMWRKNAHVDRDSIYGVDINRNYAYRWGECNGSSGSKWSDTYRGATPSSEPETKALTTLTDFVHPTAYLSYHSYSELVLYPYGCEGDLTSENKMIQTIANELAAILPRDDRGSNYTPGAPWQILYGVDGDSMDFMYAAYGALGYTFEVNQDFQPSYDLREPTVIKHRKAWTYFLNRATQNMLKIQVVDQKRAQNAEALIMVDKIQHAKKELPLKTNQFGVFFKVLDPGEYMITAQLADGRTNKIKVVMQGQPQETTILIK